MELTFLGTSSRDNGCPTLFATDRETVVVQGWRVTDPAALAAVDLPPHETAVEVPRGLFRFLPPTVG